MDLNKIVIVDGVRTAIGRYGGTLRNISSSYLASDVISGLLKRVNVSPSTVEEVILGEVRQSSQSSNVARVAALRAGIPETSPLLL